MPTPYQPPNVDTTGALTNFFNPFSGGQTTYNQYNPYQAGAIYDPTQSNAKNPVIQMMMARAAGQGGIQSIGQGPSPAQMAEQAGIEQARKQAASMAAGSTNPALARHQALATMAGISAQGAQAGAQAVAQEQIANQQMRQQLQQQSLGGYTNLLQAQQAMIANQQQAAGKEAADISSANTQNAAQAQSKGGGILGFASNLLGSL